MLKILLRFFTLMSMLGLATGANADGIRANISGIPAGATGIIAVVDGNGTYYRSAAAVSGSPMSMDIGVPVGTGYRLRIIAVKGPGTFPSVIAGGKIINQSVVSSLFTVAPVSLTTPTLTTDPTNPTSVATGASTTLKWTITDPSNFLDEASSMRMWSSTGSPFTVNLSGAQTSAARTGQSGDNYTYSLTFTAPSSPTTLYYQFGEASSPFDDPSQAPFLVLPDRNMGGCLRALAVGIPIPKPACIPIIPLLMLLLD